MGQVRGDVSRPTAVPAIVTIGKKSISPERAPSDVKIDGTDNSKVALER
jgi:hypothetical protein